MNAFGYAIKERGLWVMEMVYGKDCALMQGRKSSVNQLWIF